jgi:Methyltransferase domain
MEDTDYALGRTDDEYSRLMAQAVLLRPLTERMLRAAGVSAGMDVLDVGCGVGDVSFLVSELVGPEGSVVGMDIDGDVLAPHRGADPSRRRRRVLRVMCPTDHHRVRSGPAGGRVAVTTARRNLQAFRRESGDRRRAVLAHARRRSRTRSQSSRRDRVLPWINPMGHIGAGHRWRAACSPR